MKTFEYTEIQPPSFKTSKDFVWALNRMGEDGWELVHFEDHIMMVFKREITQEMREARKQEADDLMWRTYREHMREAHDTQVYIDVDIVTNHRSKFPDCEFGLIWEKS